MSLATRCPDCGTIFRVVQDQLRVSHGWVRCGRCSAAFNAIEALVELDHRRASAAAVTQARAHAGDEAAGSEGSSHDMPAGDRLDAGTPPPATLHRQHERQQMAGSSGHAEVIAATARPALDADSGSVAGKSAAGGRGAETPIGATRASGDSSPHRPGDVSARNATAMTAPESERDGAAIGIDRAAAAGAAQATVGDVTEPSVATRWVATAAVAGSQETASSTADAGFSSATPESRGSRASEPALDSAELDPLQLGPSTDVGAAPAATTEAVLDLTPLGQGSGVSIAAASGSAAHLVPPQRIDRADADGATVAPSFLRKAQRAERWQRPAVRAWLILLCLLGVAGLAGQMLYTFRDWVVARAPALRAPLARACSLLGCELGELRHIDALSVESSGLVRVDGQGLYRLSVTLRNRMPVDVAVPALDLQLTDGQGGLIARRVLSLSELGVAARTIHAGSELPVQALLNVRDRTVSGYTVEIFYP